MADTPDVFRQVANLQKSLDRLMARLRREVAAVRKGADGVYDALTSQNRGRDPYSDEPWRKPTSAQWHTACCRADRLRRRCDRLLPDEE